MADQRATRHQPAFPLRVGVLGAAGIVHKTWPALHQAGHCVTCIGCRDAERANKLVKEVMEKIAQVSAEPVAHAPRIAADYEEVVSAADVDVVYIPIPTALRDYWVRRCIEHGKHVVGEKPAASSASQLYEWLSLMAPRRLLYMDGTMLSHSQRVRCVEAALQKLGPLHHIDVNFSFLANSDFLAKDIRVNTALEPQGALGDLGWYAIRWILHLVQFTLPSHLSARVLATTPSSLAPTTSPSENTPNDVEETGGAITAFEGHLTFPAREGDGGHRPVTATFFCSFQAGYEQTVRAYARDGTVTVHGAINPTGEAAPGFTIERARWTLDETGGKRPLEMDVDIEDGVVKPLPVPSVAAIAPTAHGTVSGTNDEREEETAYQIVQLWRDFGDALIRLGRHEPILIHPEKGKHWTTAAYLTQYVLDQLLAAAEANAAAVAEATKRQAEAEAARKARAAAAAASAAESAANARSALTASPRRSGAAGKDTASEGGFPFALF